MATWFALMQRRSCISSHILTLPTRNSRKLQPRHHETSEPTGLDVPKATVMTVRIKLWWHPCVLYLRRKLLLACASSMLILNLSIRWHRPNEIIRNVNRSLLVPF